MSQIKTDRDNGLIPAAGLVKFRLKMYNAKHTFTTPNNFDLLLSPVSASWEEGRGLDMATYSDKTNNGLGSDWIQRAGTNIAHSLRFTFVSDTAADYGAGTDGEETPAGTNYVVLYNQGNKFNFWFNDGSNDYEPSATGTNVAVSISIFI